MTACLTPARPTLPTDRFWQLDYNKLELPVSLGSSFTLDLPAAAQAQGVIFCGLGEAQRQHPDLLALGLRSSINDDESRFTQLASKDAESGFFCYVPAGVRLAAPLELQIDRAWAGRGVVVLGPDAHAEIIETITAESSETFLCELTEMVLGERAQLRYTSVQTCGPSLRAFFTRRAIVAADAQLHLASAEIGAQSVQSYGDAILRAPGARADISVLAFASQQRYLDLGNDLHHAAPQTTSTTLVKAAAIESGRGRYYGNIRIDAHAHGADATLRDDTLLLSPQAHIDSVPALEIAANDVKAFHGATVGSVDDEQRFYAMSRGLSRAAAERMITLGFFEPVIARFPNEVVREFLRDQLNTRVG